MSPPAVYIAREIIPDHTKIINEVLKIACSPLGERAQRLRTGGCAAVSQAGAGIFQHANKIIMSI
jgi:hypothetical protein